MIDNKMIGFIGGGHMAEALIRGLLHNSAVAPTRVMVSGPRSTRLEKLHELYGLVTTTDNRQLVRQADIVVLSVKPAVLPAVATELQSLGPNLLKEKLFISVAAGVTTSTMQSHLGESMRILRTMPNTPTFVRTGVTVLASDANITDTDWKAARAIFNTVGITVEIPENQIDAATGISGSGPAYVFLILEAMADAGVKLGLARESALRLAAHTVMGAAKLLVDTDGHPGQLKDMVTSPGGTTIVGLHALEKGGVRTAMMNAVEAAANRANELGGNS